jgi:hypothetical protein
MITTYTDCQNRHRSTFALPQPVAADVSASATSRVRVMFRLYDGVGDLDPLDPDNFDAVQSAIRCQRPRPFLPISDPFNGALKRPTQKANS